MKLAADKCKSLACVCNPGRNPFISGTPLAFIRCPTKSISIDQRRVQSVTQSVTVIACIHRSGAGAKTLETEFLQSEVIRVNDIVTSHIQIHFICVYSANAHLHPVCMQIQSKSIHSEYHSRAAIAKSSIRGDF